MADIPKLVNLMNSQYNRKFDENYFYWQYFQSEYPTLSMCAFDSSNKLVGMFGCQKRHLTSKINICQAIDLLVIPEMRGTGLFCYLGDQALKKFDSIDVLCVLPNLNGKNAVEKALQWKTIAKIGMMELYKENFLKLVSGEVIQENEQRIYHNITRFYYNDEIRNWRFNRHPYYKYYRCEITSDIFVIYKIFIDPISNDKYGDIVYYQCDLRDVQMLESLILKAVEDLFKREITHITTWSPTHLKPINVFRSLGFVDVCKERYFCIKVLNNEYNYLYDFRNWHLFQSDAEIY